MLLTAKKQFQGFYGKVLHEAKLLLQKKDSTTAANKHFIICNTTHLLPQEHELTSATSRGQKLLGDRRQGVTRKIDYTQGSPKDPDPCPKLLNRAYQMELQGAERPETEIH
ncbi:hypothetical protein I79_011009 [Cricetulus griseus]|uniref:Uncharacterized protein n=1 Tax=Cricetulus griseus TaxID=10029 RepID=G3HK01_CRIGR|nr:hypothetical protein I79_011009 [Cricetulus griseus]